MRVLVTGGSGFLGTNLVDYFASKGDDVLNIDFAKPRSPEHWKYWIDCDLHDDISLAERIQRFGPQAILHMAARTDLHGRSVEDYSVNTRGVDNLIRAVEGLDSLERIIFASSRLVCKIGVQPTNDQDYCPSTAYGESKVIGEQRVRGAVERLPCPWMIVRPTSIWGPWFDVPYKTFFLMVARGLYVHPRLMRIPKSFGFVGNTVYQLDRLLRAPKEQTQGRVFYLGDYPAIDVEAMAHAIQRALGSRPIRSVDKRLLRFAARAGDALQRFGWRNPPLTTFRLENLMTPMVHDLEPLEELVGALPHSMEEGVEITTRWLRSQGQVG